MADASSRLTRRLTADDAVAFRLLRLEAVTDSPTSFLKNTEETAATPLETIAADFSGPRNSAVLGTFVGDTLAAVIGLRQEAFAKRQHLATIWGVYTRPAYRRQQLSRTLLQHALRLARETGEITAVLLYVNPANSAAKSLYQSCGFTTIGHQPMSLRVDGDYVAEELMMLTLPEQSGSVT
jgi:ribosomal protein S18 acetylase RimI-like enzyme